MTRAISRFAITITLIVALFAPIATPQPLGTTARDAYIDAWFLETAEGDLDAALKAYRLCIDRAAAEDRELAAKAIWRMGRIARSRGEEDVAVALFGQVTRDYAGTVAAGKASSDLTSPEPKGAAESDAVAQAKQILGELLNNVNMSPARDAFVFDHLSAEEIVEFHTLHGGSLFSFIQRYRYKPNVRIETALASGSIYDTNKLLYDLIENDVEFAITEELLQYAQESAYIATPLATLLASRDDAASSALLMRLLNSDGLQSRSPNPRLFIALAKNGAPELIEILKDRIDLALRHDFLYASDIQADFVVQDTPAGDAFRHALHRLPPSERLEFYSEREPECKRGPFLDQWLADPEPTIVQIALRRLFRSDDQALFADGLKRFVATGPPWDISFFYDNIGNGPAFQPPTLFLDELNELPLSLRSVVYCVWLRTPRAPEILDHALRHGNHEALSAAWLGVNLARPEFSNVPSNNWGSAAVKWDRFSSSIDAYPDTSLLPRIGEVIVRSEEPRLRLAFVEFLGGLSAQPSVAAEAASLFVHDRSPVVRLELASRLYERLSRESRLALLDDPSFPVWSVALEKERDETVFSLAASRLSPDRLKRLGDRLMALNLTAPLRTVYRRLPNDSDSILELFRFLSNTDLEITLETLARGTSIRRYNREAAQVLSELYQLPEDLKGAVKDLVTTSDGDPSRFDDVADQLRNRTDEVKPAWQLRLISYATVDYRPEKLDYTARRLAELNARDELSYIEQSHAGDPDFRHLVIQSYAYLGEREIVRDYLVQSQHPDRYVGGLADAGMADLLLELIDEGLLLANQPAWFRTAPDAIVADFMVGQQDEVGIPRLASTHSLVPRTVEYLRSTGDVDRLLRSVVFYDPNPTAVAALFDLRAYDAIITALPRWRYRPRHQALTELQSLAGLPPGDAMWPQFLVDQQALMAKWREALEDNPK